MTNAAGAVTDSYGLDPVGNRLSASSSYCKAVDTWSMSWASMFAP